MNDMTDNGALLLSVANTAKALGISLNLAYTQINEGVIPSVKIGRRILVSRAALEQWIARESSVGDSEPAVLSSRPQH